MARRTWMQRLARWHIWLGWIVALPLLIWTVTGLFMVLRPIEDVRGDLLRKEMGTQTIAAGQFVLPPSFPDNATKITVSREPYGIITRIELADGRIARADASGLPLRDFNELAARELVKNSIIGGDKVATARLFPADDVPFDFRRPMPVWQIVLADGTHVYVGKESGRIEAVRTRWWRWFDFMWGLHILDPQTREDSSHPLLIGAAALSLIGVVIGAILLFRRRRARA